MRNRAVLYAVVALVAPSAWIAVAQDAAPPALDARATIGKDISPVTLNVTGQNYTAVYYGSYLVNAVGGCNDCHTCPSYKGTNPFNVGGKALGSTKTPGPVNSANYLAGGTPFGPFVSYNLTPDTNGLPGGMTLAQFINAMVDGVDSHDGGILQVMPWPTYRHMFTTADIPAIYSYLKAIPAAQPGTCTGSGQTGQ